MARLGVFCFAAVLVIVSSQEPIDGGWSVWITPSWSICRGTCGQGSQFETRQCNNPRPQFGGKDCEGDDRRTVPCELDPCAGEPVDGGWSDWLPRTTCSATCGEIGYQGEWRVCNDPLPEFGGKYCEGDDRRTVRCDRGPCPDPCAPGCQNGGVCNGNTCDCPIGFSGDYCTTELSCKMYLDNEVTTFYGSNVTVVPSNNRAKVVLIQDTPATTVRQECRFNIRARFNGKGFVAMNFGPSEARNKHAFTLYFNYRGQGQVKLAQRGERGKKPVDATSGYNVTVDDTSIRVQGTATVGYDVTSLSGCPYHFKYFHEKGQKDLIFVAYLEPDSFDTRGECGQI